MLGKTNWVKKGNWVRVGDCPRWRRVLDVKPGRLNTRFKLEGDIPVWVKPTQESIWYEDRPGYAKN